MAGFLILAASFCLTEVLFVFELGRGSEAFAATPISLEKVPATIKAIKPAAQPVVALPRLREARPRPRAWSVASTADDESWEQF